MMRRTWGEDATVANVWRTVRRWLIVAKKVGRGPGPVHHIGPNPNAPLWIARRELVNYRCLGNPNPGTEEAAPASRHLAISAICKVMECFIAVVPPDNFDVEAMQTIKARLKEWRGSHKSNHIPPDSSSMGALRVGVYGRTTGNTLPTESRINIHGKTV